MKPALIVESDQMLAGALTLLLQSSGFTVSVVQDCSAALQYLQESSLPFVVLFLDYIASLPLTLALLTRLKDDIALQRHRFFLFSGGVEALLAPLHQLVIACPVTILARPPTWNAIIPILEQAASEGG